MTKRALLTSIAIAAVLFGCSRAPDVTLTLTLDSADPANVAATRFVLERRFEDFRPDFFARRSSAIDGPRVAFVFHGGAPDPAVLERLYRTPGELRAALRGSPEPVWFTESDIDDVTVMDRDSQRTLAIRLSDEAGRRMLQLTAQHLGESLRLTFDGQVLNDARINGVFGPSFEIAGIPQSDLQEWAVFVAVLRHGALRARVVDASVDAPVQAAR